MNGDTPTTIGKYCDEKMRNRIAKREARTCNQTLQEMGDQLNVVFVFGERRFILLGN